MSITFAQAVEDNHWLGDVRHVYSVGPYDIVEYKVNAKKWPKTEYEYGFSGYIDGKSTSESWTSLDKAMVGLVCRKHDGANSRAAYYIFDMLRMPNEFATPAQSPQGSETP